MTRGARPWVSIRLGQLQPPGPIVGHQTNRDSRWVTIAPKANDTWSTPSGNIAGNDMLREICRVPHLAKSIPTVPKRQPFCVIFTSWMAWFLDAGRGGDHSARAHDLRARLWSKSWIGYTRGLSVDPIPLACRSSGSRIHHAVVLPLYAAGRPYC